MGAPLDYYVDSDFWTFGGNDRLTVHCDASFINMGDGNDRLILTGAWNHIRMGDGNDSVGFISPDMGVTQIGNHFHLGKDDDTAIINGNQNTIVVQKETTRSPFGEKRTELIWGMETTLWFLMAVHR